MIRELLHKAGSGLRDVEGTQVWAAENFALSIGLLRECPYHGEPFQPPSRRLMGSKPYAAKLVDPRDPSMQLFHGNTRELLATAQKLINLNPNNPTGYYYKALAVQSASTLKTDDAESRARSRA